MQDIQILDSGRCLHSKGESRRNRYSRKHNDGKKTTEMNKHYVSSRSVKLTSLEKFTGVILFKEEMRRRDWVFRKLEMQSS